VVCHVEVKDLAKALASQNGHSDVVRRSIVVVDLTGCDHMSNQRIYLDFLKGTIATRRRRSAESICSRQRHMSCIDRS
jgi:hypothetical protein